jgi:hypothetical protein
MNKKSRCMCHCGCKLMRGTDKKTICQGCGKPYPMEDENEKN